MPEIINDLQFEEEVLNSELPVLVDFFAEWCMPCKMIAPALEEISTEMEAKAKIIKVDIDESMNTAVKYGIKSVPTLLFFKSGKVVDTIIGAVSKEEIKNKLLTLIDNNNVDYA